MSRCMMHEKLTIWIHVTTCGWMLCIIQGGTRMQKKKKKRLWIWKLYTWYHECI